MEENLSEASIKEIEDILDTKIYPGTDIMRDVGSYCFIKAGDSDPNGRVLVPQPCNDPRDPLNWSPFWKAITISCGCLLSLSLNLGPLANAPLFNAYMEEWDVSLDAAIQFTGVAILVLGFSNFIWVPIMTTFGRRPVMILAPLICAFSSIWRARATSYGSFMGASVLNGLAAGPCETIMPQIIADIIFLHERGKYQTLYFTAYFISLMIGPIIAGAMAQHYGWRSFWWFNTALLFFTWAYNTFLFPETRYSRERGIPKQQPHSSGEPFPHKQSFEGTKQKSDQSTDMKSGTSLNPMGDLTVTGQDSWLHKGSPDKKLLLKPYSRFEGNFFRELWLPLYLHIFPIVEFAAFAVSFSASGFLMANLTQQAAFAPPPYNFSPQSVGFTNFATLAGAIVGLITSGPLSDWIADYLTKRNNGVREPEMRLLAMIPFWILMIVGCVVTVVGYDRHWPWQVIVILGYTLLGIQVTSLPSIASTYAIDSYKPVTGSLFVAITVNKNVWGYGFSKYILAWQERSGGFIIPGMVTMGLIAFFNACGIIFWFWGKKFRGLTKDSFVHKL